MLILNIQINMITTIVKTKAKATLKLYNMINSYLFEQEYGDLKGVSASDIDKIKECKGVLAKIINKNK